MPPKIPENLLRRIVIAASYRCHPGNAGIRFAHGIKLTGYFIGPQADGNKVLFFIAQIKALTVT